MNIANYVRHIDLSDARFPEHNSERIETPFSHIWHIGPFKLALSKWFHLKDGVRGSRNHRLELTIGRLDTEFTWRKPLK